MTVCQGQRARRVGIAHQSRRVGIAHQEKARRVGIAHQEKLAPRWAVPTLQANPAGFTLFEVIVAIAIGMLLVGALYTALSLHVSRMERGYGDVEEAAVARGVLRKITFDLRNAIYHAPQPATQGSGTGQGDGTGSADGTGQGGGTGQGDGTGQGEGDAGQQTTQSSGRELGFWGESNWILFDVGLPLRSLTGVESSDEAVGDLEMVLYALGEPSGDDQNQGLLRKHILRSEAEAAGFDMTTLFEATEQTQSLAAEVVELEFRFFDGAEWSDSWDSGLMAALPRAIEVTVSIARAGAGDGDEQGVRYRSVVGMPTAAANRVQDDYLLLGGGS